MSGCRNLCRWGFGCGELPLHCATGAQRPQLTTLLERCAVECLGRDKVLTVEQPSLGAEDFAELLRDVPGMMVRLGVAGPRCAPLHNGARWRKTLWVLVLRFSRPPCWPGSRRTHRHEPTSCGDLGFSWGSIADPPRAAGHKPAPGQGPGAGPACRACGFGSHHQQRSRSAAPPGLLADHQRARTPAQTHGPIRNVLISSRSARPLPAGIR